MSTLTVHCRWEDETARERTGHPPSYAEAKKMKSLTLHTHGCLRASSFSVVINRAEKRSDRRIINIHKKSVHVMNIQICQAVVYMPMFLYQPLKPKRVIEPFGSLAHVPGTVFLHPSRTPKVYRLLENS